MAEPRVALVHDWLTGMRGGEKVLLELCRLFPSARIYTLLWNRGSVHREIEERVAQVSLLQKLPAAGRSYRYYLPLFPGAIRSLKLPGADLVISSSHAVAKGVRVPRGAKHVSYVHTPMRYLWDESGNYFQFGRGRWWKQAALGAASPYLRRFDTATTDDVDDFIANSRNVRERIRAAYGREASVIYPPVDTDFFSPGSSAPADEYLIVSSLEPYKRIDLALEAFRILRKPLLVAGSGTMAKELQALAPPNVRFVGAVPGHELRRLYRRCRALIFPGIEDFGMTAVEAMACGRPVIYCGQGGVTESVLDGETGVSFWPQTAGALAAAVERAGRMAFSARRIRERSLRYSRRRFHDNIGEFFASRPGYSGLAPVTYRARLTDEPVARFHPA